MTSQITAALFVLALLIFYAVLSVKQSAEQPHLPLVKASGADCQKLRNPCEYLDCRPNRPRGLLDPDAGEWDQRRTV